MSTARTAWIIGASSGIGRALAEQLHADGWQLVISARNQKALEALSETLSARVLVCDATEPESLKAAAADAFTSHIDCVISNVGDYQPMGLSNFNSHTLSALTRSNFISAAYLIESVLPHLQVQQGGQLLFNVSASVYRGLPNAAAYGASKAALLHLSLIHI